MLDNKTAKDTNTTHSQNRFAIEGKSAFQGISDAELWQKFSSGDEAVFIFLYKEYFDSLYQYARQFTHSNELVEDAIQDVFIELREKRAKLVIKSSIKFYLFKTLKRKVVGLLEKNRKNLSLDDRDSYREFQVTFSAEHRLIESQLETEQKERLARSMQSLTARQREAIYYFYYENMSYAEIQELMDFSQIQGIRNLMYRALNELKTQLSPQIIALAFLSVREV